MRGEVWGRLVVGGQGWEFSGRSGNEGFLSHSQVWQRQWRWSWNSFQFWHGCTTTSAQLPRLRDWSLLALNFVNPLYTLFLSTLWSTLWSPLSSHPFHLPSSSSSTSILTLLILPPHCPFSPSSLTPLLPLHTLPSPYLLTLPPGEGPLCQAASFLSLSLLRHCHPSHTHWTCHSNSGTHGRSGRWRLFQLVPLFIRGYL